LTFDILAPKVDSFIPLSRGPVRMKKNRFIHFQTITFTNKVTDERTDKRTAWEHNDPGVQSDVAEA